MGDQDSFRAAANAHQVKRCFVRLYSPTHRVCLTCVQAMLCSSVSPDVADPSGRSDVEQAILRLLDRCEMTAGELAKRFGMHRTMRAIARLKHDGLVGMDTRGRSRVYRGKIVCGSGQS